MKKLKAKDYSFISLDEAMQDDVYTQRESLSQKMGSVMGLPLDDQ